MRAFPIFSCLFLTIVAIPVFAASKDCRSETIADGHGVYQGCQVSAAGGAKSRGKPIGKLLPPTQISQSDCPLYCTSKYAQPGIAMIPVAPPAKAKKPLAPNDNVSKVQKIK